MKLIILESAEEVASWTAKFVAKKINDFKPDSTNFFVLGLPTGICFFLNIIFLKYIEDFN